MLEIGDSVVYRNHVCRVAGVREAYFEGKDYYELHTLFEGSLKFYIAMADAKPPVLRQAMSRKEAMSLIDSIPGIEAIDEKALEAVAVRSTRAIAERQLKEEYSRRLSQCSPRDLVVVVKSAYERTRDRASAGKQAIAVDKRFLDLAESLLCDELAVSLDMPREDVPAFLHDRVSRLAGE